MRESLNGLGAIYLGAGGPVPRTYNNYEGPTVMTHEVAYFQYMRKLKSQTAAEEDPSKYKYGDVLRPEIYTPNYDFYVPDLVCWEHQRPKVKWSGEYNKWTTEDSESLQGFECVDCGLLDPVSFKKCPSCQGAFYDLFRHPYQTKSLHHCWTCLENDSNETPHDFYSKYSKLAPPEKLIPPVVTMADVERSDNSFWDNINKLLSS